MFDLSTLVKVKLKSPDDFLKVKETLTRIGIASKAEKVLYQSCHLLHKRGEYYILHFKELFLLDGKKADFSDEDKARRNTITNLLAEWGLVEVINPKQIQEPRASLSNIKILPFKEKDQYELVAKYSIGKKKNPNYNVDE
jgi:hypothetical protein